MGILDNIGVGKKKRPHVGGAKPAGAGAGAGGRPGARPGTPGASVSRSRPGPTGSGPKVGLGGLGGKGGKGGRSRLPGKRRRKGAPSPKERIASAAAPLHDRRRRLVGAREATLRDLGGLMLEMYKRNRFREELLLDKCEEVLAIEVEIAHVDQRLFQLAPPNAAGMRAIGRCECDAPIHPGQNFCGVCGRSFATLTQGRSCARCGSGLRPGDHYCATCGSEAPDALQTIEAAPASPGMATPPIIDAASIATNAVAETVVIEAPPIDPSPPPAAAPAGNQPPGTETPAPATAPPAPEPARPAPAEPAPVAQPFPAAESAPAEAPPAGERFDWTASAPGAADVAMDAALDALPPSPTDPSTPFAGFPLTSTVPPPPVVDPTGGVPPLVPEELPSPAPAAPGAASAPPSQPAEALDPKAAKRAAKELATAKKQRAKAAKARAKERAKAARDARKRGGSE